MLRRECPGQERIAGRVVVALPLCLAGCRLGVLLD